jgi:membrane complex biogenesis BtpA family protein
MPVRSPLDARPLLVGVVHLPALPGAPAWRPTRHGRPDFVARAVSDAVAYAEAGFDAVIVENYGDAPFFKDAVPAETVASLAAACHAVRTVLSGAMAVGVNVLRNDGLSAMSVAAACGLDFVRVNVLAGTMATDQGVVEGRAAEIARARARLSPRVRIWADVRVKHAVPVAPRNLDEEVRDLVHRGGADLVIVTGPRTGAPADLDRLRAVRSAADGTPLVVGSGATAANVAAALAVADGVIVGTSVKRGGATGNPVDPGRARAFASAARRQRR